MHQGCETVTKRAPLSGPIQTRGHGRVPNAKRTKYEPLRLELLRQYSKVTILPFIVGSIGSWFPGNDRVLSSLHIGHRYAGTSAPEFNCTSSLYICTTKTVLLQTASAVVSNPHNPGPSMKLRTVLDNGSQRSYLTQHARNVLCLQTNNKQRLAIAAFGSKRAEPQLCDLVRARVQKKEGQKIMIDLFVVRHICEPLCKQPLEECLGCYPHLAGLELTDNFTKGPHVIDMLISSDFYWHIVTGELIRGEKGPVAIKSTLVWILSGPVQSVSHECVVNLLTTHVLKANGVTNKMLDDTMRSFWELESMGIQVKA